MFHLKLFQKVSQNKHLVKLLKNICTFSAFSVLHSTHKREEYILLPSLKKMYMRPEMQRNI